MAFDRIKEKWGGKSKAGKAAMFLGPGAIFGTSHGPLAKILGNDKKDKDKFAPQAQFYGGSADESQRYRDQYGEGAKAGTANIGGAVERLQDSARTADRSLSSRSATADDLLNRSVSRGEVAGQGFDSSIGDYKRGRGAILGNAGQLEKMAADAPGQYKQTSDQQFRLNQDRNTRAALSTAAGRGAAGLRTALATSSQANADAAGQAEVTRAQEFNELQQQRQNALVQGAGIRSGVGTQDQNAAGQYSGRQQQYEQNAIGANEQGGGFDLQRANVQQGAAGLQGQLGLGTQGQYLNAQGNLETSQLQANQKNEDQRQLSARDQYNRRWSPIMSSFNQA